MAGDGRRAGLTLRRTSWPATALTQVASGPVPAGVGGDGPAVAQYIWAPPD